MTTGEIHLGEREADWALCGRSIDGIVNAGGQSLLPDHAEDATCPTCKAAASGSERASTSRCRQCGALVSECVCGEHSEDTPHD